MDISVSQVVTGRKEMKGPKIGMFRRPISRDQASDTGMAFVLICLILTFFLDNLMYVKIAIVLLMIDMVVPQIYKYPAILWLGLSRIIGAVISRILLTAVFFIIVTPVGFIRRLFGFDSLKLREFGKDTGSVMIERDKSFTSDDLKKPY
jgi:hypothetical protein